MNDRRTTDTSVPRACAAAVTAICTGLALGAAGALPAQGVVSPGSCAHPAPVENTFDPTTPNVTLMIRSNIDLQTIAERLSRLYGVQPHGRRFIHSLALKAVTPELVEKLRCEPGIELLSYDVPMYPPEHAQ